MLSFVSVRADGQLLVVAQLNQDFTSTALKFFALSPALNK